MAEGRRGLGRGLSALMDEAGAATTPEARRAAGVRELAIEAVVRNPGQPRRAFDDNELEELAASIRQRGVIAPILVRPTSTDETQFEIVAGERRWRAAQRAGLRTIPAVVRGMGDAEMMELALIENIQRADLNALEEARGYAALVETYKHGAEAIARAVGKSRSHVANTLRLMRLPESVRAHVEAGRLSAGHARALLDIEGAESLAERIIKQGLNVRQTEALAKRAKAGAKGAGSSRTKGTDADTVDLQTTLSNALGLAVEVRDRAGAGEVRIRYGTLEQLDEVCSRLMRGTGVR